MFLFYLLGYKLYDETVFFFHSFIHSSISRAYTYGG